MRYFRIRQLAHFKTDSTCDCSRLKVEVTRTRLAARMSQKLAHQSTRLAKSEKLKRKLMRERQRQMLRSLLRTALKLRPRRTELRRKRPKNHQLKAKRRPRARTKKKHQRRRRLHPRKRRHLLLLLVQFLAAGLKPRSTMQMKKAKKFHTRKKSPSLRQRRRRHQPRSQQPRSKRLMMLQLQKSQRVDQPATQRRLTNRSGRSHYNTPMGLGQHIYIFVILWNFSWNVRMKDSVVPSFCFALLCASFCPPTLYPVFQATARPA